MITHKHSIVNRFIALVWLVNGLFCKVIGLVPRHQEIVGRILGTEYSELLTLTIGVAEVAMAIWILTRIRSKFNAIIQIVIVILMNIIECIHAPDLLLWGAFNLVFAFLFVALVYYNEFWVVRN